ncbi:hypothetical protein [Pedobacter panaciterrae]
MFTKREKHIKQIVIDAFNHHLIKRDTERDTNEDLGFIYDELSPFTVAVIVTENTIQIRSKIAFNTALAKDKIGKQVVKDAIKKAGIKTDLSLDND